MSETLNYKQSTEKQNTTNKTNDLLLDVKDLHTYFFTEEGIVKAVDGVSFQIITMKYLDLSERQVVENPSPLCLC